MSDHAAGQKLSLVVDGGGTKTYCHLLAGTGDAVHVLGAGVATGSNPMAIGVGAAATAIRSAVAQAFEAAGVAPATPVDRAALAVAGTVDDDFRGQLEQAFANNPIARECRVFPDVWPIVLAAAIDGPAAALIAGTGSVVVVRGEHGRCALIGGRGYLLGDEGSGYAIGREAIRVTLDRLETGHNESPLVARVLQTLGTTTIEEIKRAVYQSDQPRRTIAAVAKAVVETASSNDPAAEAILDAAAADLVGLVQLGVARIGLEFDAVPLAVAGGLFGADSPLRSCFEQRLKAVARPERLVYVDQPIVAAEQLLRDEVFHSKVKLFA